MPSGEHAKRMDRVESHFDEEATVYDDVIERIIPGYVDQNEALLDALSLPSGTSRVADLGIGTGQLADLVLQRHQETTLVGYDLSQGMLDQAAGNLARFGSRVEFVRVDLAEIDLRPSFDAIVAGLSVHHLDDAAKRVLFSRTFEALRPGGVFVLRDIVLGETAEESECLYQEWRAFIRGNGLDDAEVLAAHHAEDTPAPLGAQLEWMCDVGFVEVRTVWREMNFAVWSGVKPAE
jgi:tRNA (cmo5U34)-methyltransferase